MLVRSKRFAVIMAGGVGTRFWPLSRRRRPKQLLSLLGRRTLLQDTAARVTPLVPRRQILVVTARDQEAAVRQQLPWLSRTNIIAEPVGRNTAPCIAVAAEWLHHLEPTSTMAVLPADHWIKDTRAFHVALRTAFTIAEQEHSLVTLGVRPTRCETGYGYVRIGAVMRGRRPPVYRIAGFYEKPSRARARRFIASGQYLWNAGIFVWRTDTVRAALERHLPSVARVVAGIGPDLHGRRAASVLRRAYRRLPTVSIDVGLMEPAARFRREAIPMAVVAAECGWDDVGSWRTLGTLWGQDAAGNAVHGRVVLRDSSGNTVVGDRRLVALLGVRDLVVVDSPDALLICREDRAQDVRRIVEELARRGWGAFL